MAMPGWKVTVLAAREKLIAVTRPRALSVSVIQRPGRREARVNMRRAHGKKNRTDRSGSRPRAGRFEVGRSTPEKPATARTGSIAEMLGHFRIPPRSGRRQAAGPQKFVSPG